eukprot:m.147126 g.147126  ORF g.147126 m.147126 type:complete len:71 (+) comp14160_c0_seq10:351-563(+)
MMGSQHQYDLQAAVAGTAPSASGASKSKGTFVRIIENASYATARVDSCGCCDCCSVTCFPRSVSSLASYV